MDPWSHRLSVIPTKLTPGPTVSRCTKTSFCNSQICKMFPTATVLDVLILTRKEERIITEFASVK